MNQDDGPLARFCEELHDLIDRWRDKPDDDKLSVAEIVGSIEIAKIALTNQALDEDD